MIDLKLTALIAALDKSTEIDAVLDGRLMDPSPGDLRLAEV